MIHFALDFAQERVATVDREGRSLDTMAIPGAGGGRWKYFEIHAGLGLPVVFSYYILFIMVDHVA